ncbi:MAG: FecR family protein [Pseudomonadota bacterium]
MRALTALRTAAVLVSALLLAPSAALAAKVGVAAAVNPDAFSGGKELRIGKSIFYNERITTDANGVVQVLLVDGSTFTVGRNSNVVIDRFVYDPNKKTGELVASFSKGSMRFIGGKISKNPGGVRVKTPDGSLAIRGGMVQGTIRPGGSIFSFLFGEEMIFTGNNGRVETVYQAGYSLVLGPSGPLIRPTTPADVQKLMASLTNSNVSSTLPETSNKPQQPSYIFTTLSLEQLIIDATSTRIDDEIQKQLQALADIGSQMESPDDPIIRSSIGGFGSGLVYSTSYGDFAIGSSNSPDDFSYNENTNVLSLTLRDVEGGGSISRGILRFQPTSANNWMLSNAKFFDANGNPLVVEEASGFVNAEPGNLCTSCSFIKWGSFGAEYTYLESPELPYPVTEQIGLGWWVGGQVTEFQDLPQTGTASYTGRAVGTIAIPQTSTTVVGKGDLGMDWNFAKRSGQFSITKFNANPVHELPDLNVGGKMTMPGNFNRFKGDIGGKVGQTPVMGGAYGSFVTDGKRPAAGVIGNWGVSGQNGYKATGVFGGVSKR